VKLLFDENLSPVAEFLVDRVKAFLVLS